MLKKTETLKWINETKLKNGRLFSRISATLTLANLMIIIISTSITFFYEQFNYYYFNSNS